MDTTHRYQIQQKVGSNIVILHPETDGSVVSVAAQSFFPAGTLDNALAAIDTKFADLPTPPSPGSTVQNVGTSGSAGSSANYSRADHVHAITLATGDNNGEIKIAGQPVPVKGLGTAAYKNEGYFDQAGAASTAEANAKSYADSLLGGVGKAIVWKGIKSTVAEIKALTNQKAGYLWGCSADHSEWIAKEDIGATASASAWEEFGHSLVDGALYKGSNTFTDGYILLADGAEGKVRCINKASINVGSASEAGHATYADSADLLDNQPGSYYLNYNNLDNRPTLGAAAAKGVTDNTVDKAIEANDTNLITGRTLYHAGYIKSAVTSVSAGAGLSGGEITTTGTISLSASGVTAGTYSALTVDQYGRATAGKQSFEVGTTVGAGPTGNLVDNGIFFKMLA